MAIFRFFKMVTAAILDFSKYKFLTVRRVLSVELRHLAKFRGDRSNRCRDISIFWFLKFQIFNGRNGQEGRTASLCQILSKSRVPRPRYGDFSIFSRWRPSAILDLCCVCWNHPRRHLVVFITVQNLVGIDAVVLIICAFFDFASLAWKHLFTGFFCGGLTP